MSEKQLTIPADVNQKVLAYWINSTLSNQAVTAIENIQFKLGERFPGALWSVPQHGLHTTLMNWIEPIDDYKGKDKEELFHGIVGEYTQTFEDLIRHQSPITVTYDRLEVHPAAIILRGHDDGSFQRIRDEFVRRVDLLEGTRNPPNIIHTTICKFLAEIDINEVKGFLAAELISVRVKVAEFRLARETKLFIPNEVIRRFALHE